MRITAAIITIIFFLLSSKDGKVLAVPEDGKEWRDVREAIDREGEMSEEWENISFREWEVFSEEGDVVKFTHPFLVIGNDTAKGFLEVVPVFIVEETPAEIIVSTRVKDNPKPLLVSYRDVEQRVEWLDTPVRTTRDHIWVEISGYTARMFAGEGEGEGETVTGFRFIQADSIDILTGDYSLDSSVSLEDDSFYDNLDDIINDSFLYVFITLMVILTLREIFVDDGKKESPTKKMRPGGN